MTTRAEFVAAARSLLGTRWLPHQRVPGVGVDCIGVPIVAAWISGARPRSFDIQGYSIAPDGSLLPWCRANLTPISREQLQPADVVVVRIGKRPHHVGVVGDYRHGGLSMIHADNFHEQKVVEHRLWFDGAIKFCEAFAVPGLEP